MNRCRWLSVRVMWMVDFNVREPAALLALTVVGALGTTTCATYHAVPLPDASVAAPARTLDEARVRATIADLHRQPAPPIEINLSDGLDPAEAALLAVLLNPDLVAARDAHADGEAQLVLAGILPNPILAANVEHPYGAGSGGTVNAINLSLGADLKPFIARGARRRAAQAGLDQIDLGIAWQEWQIAQQARLLVVRLGWIRRRLKVARDELDFAEQTTKSMNAAGRAGDVTVEQLGVHRAAMEGVRRVSHQLEQAEVDTESALRTLLGPAGVGTLEVVEPSGTSDGGGRPPTIDACLAGRLDLAALRRGYQAEEEQVRAAVLDQFPGVTVGIAYQHNEVELNFAGGFLTLAVPIFDRNQAQVKIGFATRRRLEHEYEARVSRARGDLDAILRFAALVARQLPEVRQSIPPLEEIELKERQAVARGDVSRLSYQTVRSALFDLRLQEETVSQALAEARVGIDSTCGVAVRKEPR